MILLIYLKYTISTLILILYFVLISINQISDLTNLARRKSQADAEYYSAKQSALSNKVSLF